MSKEAKTFEELMKRLEKIVEELEEGGLSLSEALERYEEGLTLAKGCSETLQKAKARVEKLIKKEGSITTEGFHLLEENQDVS